MSNSSSAEMSPSTLPGEPDSEKRPNTTRSKSKREAVHNENHNDYGDIIRDIIIGFADGLTVPFALTAGLSSLGSARLVIIGGKYTSYS
jgi:vacuolar iron transporter family protein